MFCEEYKGYRSLRWGQRSMQLRRSSVMVASSKCQRKNCNTAVTHWQLSLCVQSCHLVVVQGHEACLCSMQTFFCKLLWFFGFFSFGHCMCFFVRIHSALQQWIQWLNALWIRTIVLNPLDDSSLTHYLGECSNSHSLCIFPPYSGFDRPYYGHSSSGWRIPPQV